jgi:hypothetical protein
MMNLQSIARAPVWVGWKTEQRDGKPTKVPYDPRTGQHAASDASATWATRREAESWAAIHGGDGVGVVLCLVDSAHLGGIDLDSCRNPTTGELAPWAAAIVDRFQTYTEISPSGKGVKLFFWISQADWSASASIMEDGRHGRAFKNGGGEHGPGIEVYRGKRYFTVTDNAIGETEIRQASIDDLAWLIREAGPAFVGKKDKSTQSGQDNSRSGKAFRRGAELKAGGKSYQEMRDALLADSDPEIADWAREKGMANGEREMKRVYANAKLNSDSNRPTILLGVGETERVVDETETALINSDRGLYRRGGLISSVGFTTMQTWDERRVEVQIICERGDFALREDIEAACNFVKPVPPKEAGEKPELKACARLWRSCGPSRNARTGCACRT